MRDTNLMLILYVVIPIIGVAALGLISYYYYLSYKEEEE